VAASGNVGRPSHCSRGICHRFFRRRELRVAANRLRLWQRALPLSFHQFVLQSALASLESRLVAEGCLLVGSAWMSAFRHHAPMDVALALFKHISTLRTLRRTAHA